VAGTAMETAITPAAATAEISRNSDLAIAGLAV
jgi:hypothetical protein